MKAPFLESFFAGLSLDGRGTSRSCFGACRSTLREGRFSPVDGRSAGRLGSTERRSTLLFCDGRFMFCDGRSLFCGRLSVRDSFRVALLSGARGTSRGALASASTGRCCGAESLRSKTGERPLPRSIRFASEGSGARRTLEEGVASALPPWRGEPVSPATDERRRSDGGRGT